MCKKKLLVSSPHEQEGNQEKKRKNRVLTMASKYRDLSVNAVVLSSKNEKIPLLQEQLLMSSTHFIGQLVEEFLHSKYKEKLKSELIQPTFIRLLNLMKPVVIALSTLIFMLILVCCSVLLYLVKVT